tara:strand:+ start:873 stop:1844 length:972 start_codon:yes stop_codon:yes gene_type:complete
MKTTPITSRLRANKQIKKDPASQPILHVGEVSPLKQAKQIGKETTTTEKGAVTTTTTSGDLVDIDKATGGTQATDSDAYVTGLKKRFPGATGQQLVDKGYISSAYADRFPTAPPSKTVTTQDPDIVKKEQEPFYTREKSDRISPYQYYQNRLIAKRSVGANKRKERGQQRGLAKEYARKEGGNLIDKLKNRRKVMRGEASQKDFTRAFGEDNGEKRFKQSQQNYEVYRGLSDKQQAAHIDTDQPHQQVNQHVGRGKSIVGRNRVATQTDIGNRDVVNQTNAGEDIVTFENGTVAKGPKMKTRHLNSVGVKQSSPMKKGYFKNK